MKVANTGLELVCNLGQWDLEAEIHFTTREEGGGNVTLEIPLAA